MKTLVVFYSQSFGNTKRIAEMIQKKLDCDIEKIKTVKPYSNNYQAVVIQGKKEVDQGYLPEIRGMSNNWEIYDRIIIGTPTWWYTMAPAVRSFLNSVNLNGKNVVLFQTHGGWKGSCIDDMKKLCNGAMICSTYDVQFDSYGGNKLVTDEQDVSNWIDSLS